MVPVSKLVMEQEVWVSETGFKHDYHKRIFSHYNHEGKPYFWNNGYSADFYNYNKSSTTSWRYVSVTDPEINTIEIWYQ